MLPLNTVLGDDWIIIEELDYYDRPLSFLCLNNRSELFFGVIVDESDDRTHETWYYFRLTEPGLYHTRNFMRSSPRVYEVTVWYDNPYIINPSETYYSRTISVKSVKGSEIPEDRLVGAGHDFYVANHTLRLGRVGPA